MQKRMEELLHVFTMSYLERPRPDCGRLVGGADKSPEAQRRDCLCGDYQDGCRRGSRVFVSSSISIPSGEKVIFLNNKSFSHNMIFEKNGVSEGVQVELISHNDYMNDEGQQFVVTLKDKGIFRFFYEPHRAASMFGETTVT
ncbi:hypothetical protein L7F22_028754 [Adiantum nelumboides]|nr:hypothetical protein [Adiantum nelumboides]